MRIRTSVAAAFILAAGVAESSAQSSNPKFRAEIDRLQKWAAKNRADRGIKVTGEGEAVTIDPFTAGRLHVVKVAPGASATVTVPGEYPAQTAILSERDGVTLRGAAMSASSYTARMAVAPDELPGFARLAAVTPISWSYATKAVAFVESVYRLELESSMGITAKVTPLEKTFTLDDQQMNARVKYQVDFYKSGEAKPFETLTGEQTFNSLDAPKDRFDVLFSQAAGSPQAQMEELNKQLADPTLTDAQRNAVMEKLGALQKKMIEDLTQVDPASVDKKRKDFGCESLSVTVKSAGIVAGHFLCGENFNGGMLDVTGTITIVR